jgi:hypothetical protein
MFIDGTYNILYLDFGSGFLPVACLTENSMADTIETLNTTTRDNSGWNTFVPTKQNISISFSGLLINTRFAGGDFTKISLDKLKDLKRNKTLISWKVENADTSISESGNGYIVSLSENDAIDEFISFDGEILASK